MIKQTAPMTPPTQEQRRIVREKPLWNEKSYSSGVGVLKPFFVDQ